jgi:hypothetical protein
MVPAFGLSGAASCAHKEGLSEDGSEVSNKKKTGRASRTRNPDQSNKAPLSWGQDPQLEQETNLRLKALISTEMEYDSLLDAASEPARCMEFFGRRGRERD